MFVVGTYCKWRLKASHPNGSFVIFFSLCIATPDLLLKIGHDHFDM